MLVTGLTALVCRQLSDYLRLRHASSLHSAEKLGESDNIGIFDLHFLFNPEIFGEYDKHSIDL